MNKYQVEWSTINGDDTLSSSYVYVDAQTREEARYVAFDELCDQGVNMAALVFGDIFIEHGGSGKFIETFERSGSS